MSTASSETVTLATGDGLRLEGLVDDPGDARGVLVLCHPHPQMRGTMNAPLLAALVEALTAARWAVIRFNFRGVGDSEGQSGDGIAEVADAVAALAEAERRFPGLPVAIAGWSFGAAVAIRVAARRSDLRACIAIAPAIEPKPGVTAGAPPAREADLGMPVLLVIGRHDDLVSPEAARAWAAEAGARFVEVPGSNHFFWARYEKLAAIVTGFLEEALT